MLSSSAWPYLNGMIWNELVRYIPGRQTLQDVPQTHRWFVLGEDEPLRQMPKDA